MPRTEQAVINWLGRPSQDAQVEGERYREEMRRFWAEDEAEDWFTVPCLPDIERKGEP